MTCYSVCPGYVIVVEEDSLSFLEWSVQVPVSEGFSLLTSLCPPVDFNRSQCLGKIHTHIRLSSVGEIRRHLISSFIELERDGNW